MDAALPQWSCQIGALGEILQGVDDIEQQIAIILHSPPGCDPLRPEFAVDLISLIDLPFAEMRWQAVGRIERALMRWMDGQIIVGKVDILPSDALATQAQILLDYRLAFEPVYLRTLILPLVRA